MSTERTPTTLPSISSRRFACDRCRLQKARCLPEHADTGCVTSPICRRRSWQIIAYDSPSQSMRGEATSRTARPRPLDSQRAQCGPAQVGTQFANSSHSTAPFYGMTQPLQESPAQHTAGMMHDSKPRSHNPPILHSIISQIAWVFPMTFSCQQHCRQPRLAGTCRRSHPATIRISKELPALGSLASAQDPTTRLPNLEEMEVLVAIIAATPSKRTQIVLFSSYPGSIMSLSLS